MKKFVCLLLIIMYGLSIKPIFAGTFFDDFNGGNADEWLSAASCSSPSWCGLGNWRIENNMVEENNGGNGYAFLKDNLVLSSHTIQARMLWHDNGGAGLTVWYKDADNWVYVSFPKDGGFIVTEKWCDYALCPRDENVSWIIYPHEFGVRDWHTLKLAANSITGEIHAYLDDDYLFTHIVGIHINRSGLSGFNSGNAGGSFDDVLITYTDPLTEKTQCKDGGWSIYGYSNQGACIRSL